MQVACTLPAHMPALCGRLLQQQWLLLLQVMRLASLYGYRGYLAALLQLACIPHAHIPALCSRQLQP